jgi:proline dehydrogenase
LSLFTRLVVATAHAQPVEKIITRTRPGKALARRFVAGDTLEEAVDAARTLNGAGPLVSFDLLGEEVHDLESARAARDEYLECLDEISVSDLEANISVKLTQLGLAIDRDLTRELLESLADRADAQGVTVTVDMEDSRYTEGTVETYETVQKSHGNLGIALQSYLHRTPADLDRLMPLGGHIRLCKGAYVEEADVALTSKADVDQAYARQLETLMLFPGVKPAIATHDLELVDRARELAGQRSEPFEFQMLFGVRGALQSELVAQGYPLRVYLPFGSQWYPYLTRRLAERPSNAWFFAKAMIGS